MHFFDLPAEIRLLVYSELLVFPPYVVLRYHCDEPGKPVLYHWRGGNRIYAEILRVNRQAFTEGSPLLYSSNRFHFPPIYGNLIHEWTGRTIREYYEAPLVAPFIAQIRSQASLITHVRINLDAFLMNEDVPAGCSEGVVLLRQNCPNLASLELAFLIRYDHLGEKWRVPVLPESRLDTLDGQFRSLPSLRDIIVDICSEVNQEAEPDYGSPKFSDMFESFRRVGWRAKPTRDCPCPRCALWFESESAVRKHLSHEVCDLVYDSDSEACQFDLYD